MMEEEIDEEEELFIMDEEYADEYEPCIHSNYYLGSYKYFPEIEEHLLMSQISKRIFYASNYYSLCKFIYWYSGAFIEDTNVQIIQVFLKNEFATAVLKTHWIRLIQRTWRRIYKERQQYILKRKQLRQIQMQQIKPMCENYPGLRGMLAHLRT
jgi:hypothetical protein